MATGRRNPVSGVARFGAGLTRGASRGLAFLAEKKAREREKEQEFQNRVALLKKGSEIRLGELDETLETQLKAQIEAASALAKPQFEAKYGAGSYDQWYNPEITYPERVKILTNDPGFVAEMAKLDKQLIVKGTGGGDKETPEFKALKFAVDLFKSRISADATRQQYNAGAIATATGATLAEDFNTLYNFVIGGVPDNDLAVTMAMKVAAKMAASATPENADDISLQIAETIRPYLGDIQAGREAEFDTNVADTFKLNTGEALDVKLSKLFEQMAAPTPTQPAPAPQPEGQGFGGFLRERLGGVVEKLTRGVSPSDPRFEEYQKVVSQLKQLSARGGLATKKGRDLINRRAELRIELNDPEEQAAMNQIDTAFGLFGVF